MVVDCAQTQLMAHLGTIKRKTQSVHKPKADTNILSKKKLSKKKCKSRLAGKKSDESQPVESRDTLQRWQKPRQAGRQTGRRWRRFQWKSKREREWSVESEATRVGQAKSAHKCGAAAEGARSQFPLPAGRLSLCAAMRAIWQEAVEQIKKKKNLKKKLEKIKKIINQLCTLPQHWVAWVVLGWSAAWWKCWLQHGNTGTRQHWHTATWKLNQRNV